MGVAIATPSITSTTFGPLVEPQELATSLQNAKPVLLDVRGYGYEEGHVPGAISAPYSLFRGPKENPGQLLDIAQLKEELEWLGLQLDDPIVIITDGKNSSDFGAAARVYWTLKSTGFADLSILNGGHMAWVEAGLSLSQDADTLEPTELDLAFNDEWLADTKYVAAVVAGEIDAVLVDARDQDYYEGKKAHKAATQPGTIPEAINHVYTSFFDGKTSKISNVSDAHVLETIFGVEDGEDVISFCNAGHWSASHWFAVSELAGVENAKLYPGSVIEYSLTSLPMKNVPGSASY